MKIREKTEQDTRTLTDKIELIKKYAEALILILITIKKNVGKRNWRRREREELRMQKVWVLMMQYKRYGWK